MKKLTAALFCWALILTLAAAVPAAGPGPGMSADAALKKLQEGNARYVAGKPQHPHQNKERRVLTATKGQTPFATILACSDSRVPVELIFDQGVGDIFVVRVAGNVAGVDEIASMEYGGEHLHTPVLVVLGHTHCGAVTAVVQDAQLHGNLPALAAKIKPAVAKTRAAHPQLKDAALLNAAIEANVRQAMADLLAQSPITNNLVKAGKLKVVGAIYDLKSGKVAWLKPQPKKKNPKAAGKAKAK